MISLVVSSLALILCIPISANAHAGKTDAAGGHYDHSTGEYHYHHGYPAHQHYDMDGDGFRDCPYDFDDKTGANSGSSGNSGESGNFTPLSYSDGYADGRNDGYSEGYEHGLEVGRENGHKEYQKEHVATEFSWVKTLSLMLLAIPLFLFAAYLCIPLVCMPAYWILNNLCVLLLSLMLRKQPQERRKHISAIITHVVLTLTLLYLLIPLAVDFIAGDKNRIAVALIASILIIFLLVALVYKKCKEIALLRSEITSLNEEESKAK